MIKTFALSDADARSRFSREAAVLRRLEHPGLIRPVAHVIFHCGAGGNPADTPSCAPLLGGQLCARTSAGFLDSCSLT